MQKIRLGMVGGGQGAFIGAVHRAAAGLDGQYDLVAGAFSGGLVCGSLPKRAVCARAGSVSAAKIAPR